MKKLLLLISVLITSNSYAIKKSDFNYIIDEKEDTTQVVTVADIAKAQENVSFESSVQDHYRNVWKRTNYFNISTGSETMSPKDEIELGYPAFNKGIAPDFKSNLALKLTLGKNYGLHKKAIANILKFNIDYTFFDLGFSRFKASATDKPVYDNDATFDVVNDNNRTEKRKYIPWCFEKYNINFGMSIGPSITIAPFTHVGGKGLHFLKLNVYYHLGYKAGIMWMKFDDKLMISEQESSSHYPSSNVKDDNSCLLWSHGLTGTFGFSLSWKSIGIGFETISDNPTFRSFNTAVYNDDNYKFKTTGSRFYLQIRY